MVLLGKGACRCLPRESASGGILEILRIEDNLCTPDGLHNTDSDASVQLVPNLGCLPVPKKELGQQGDAD
jgi:hypothetical protein